VKKIIACVQVQNDADIIESLCRYYCSFCDGILVTDDMSTDNTPDIIKSLAEEGLPVLITDKKDIDLGLGRPNARWQQLHLAVDRCGAELILTRDADEFLVCADGGNPRPVLTSLDEKIEYHIIRRNYICPQEIQDDTLFFPSAIDKYTELLSQKAIIHRFLLKEKKAWPVAGVHSFFYADDQPIIADMKTLCYNHYPIRGVYQFMLKIMLGRVHYLTYPYYDGDRHYNMAWHWKVFYDEIKKNSTISQEMLERFSQYTASTVPGDNTGPLMESAFDTSFCHDKLKLRYTKYGSGKDYFLQILATQLEKNLLRMPSWRSTAERKVAGEQLGQANETIHNLNAYIETLNKNVLPVRACTFYFDTGKDFNEEETVHFQHEKGENVFYNKVILPENIKAVRFDPVEGCGCFLQDLNILDNDGKNIDYEIINGFRSENNGIVFTNTDPQILISINETKIKELTVQCSIWLFS
jgi:hypothetical protein